MSLNYSLWNFSQLLYFIHLLPHVKLQAVSKVCLLFKLFSRHTHYKKRRHHKVEYIDNGIWNQNSSVIAEFIWLYYGLLLQVSHTTTGSLKCNTLIAHLNKGGTCLQSASLILSWQSNEHFLIGIGNNFSINGGTKLGKW